MLWLLLPWGRILFFPYLHTWTFITLFYLDLYFIFILFLDFYIPFLFGLFSTFFLPFLLFSQSWSHLRFPPSFFWYLRFLSCWIVKCIRFWSRKFLLSESDIVNDEANETESLQKPYKIFKSFSQSLEQFFLSVGQNNFGNKIPFLFVLYFFPLFSFLSEPWSHLRFIQSFFYFSRFVLCWILKCFHF